MKRFIYNLLFPLGFVAYLPVFVWKLIRRGGYSHHFLERFGFYSRMQKERLRRLSSPVWVHAVSVGEIVTAAAFIRRWQERQPHAEFVVTVTTTTGYATAQKRLPDTNVVLLYSPLDFFTIVWRAFRAIRPVMLVIFEVEFWPNMILEARRRGVPIVLANGRMSDRSAPGYARHRWFFRDIFGAFSSMCVQTAEDAARIRRVIDDAVPIHVCGTMKFDLTPDVDVGREQRALLDQVFGPSPRCIWTAGSTHAGEEEWVVDAFLELRQELPDLRLVLVPRHHERTGEVEALLQNRGVRYRLRNPRQENGAASSDPADVLLVNTTGELLGFYAVSDVVFVGKSLAGNHGGHNIIEPALFGVPVIHGPYMENFREVADIFRTEHAALQCDDRYEALRDAVRELLRNPQKRAELGRRGREVIERYRGAIDRTLDIILPLIQAGAG